MHFSKKLLLSLQNYFRALKFFLPESKHTATTTRALFSEKALFLLSFHKEKE